LRILFDNNVPVGVRRFLVKHEVRTVVEMDWPPQLELRPYEEVIAAKVDGATPGSFGSIEMPLPPKSRTR